MPFIFNPLSAKFDYYKSTDALVVGPASSTDHALARFDGITGKLLEDSVIISSDAGDLSGILSETTSPVKGTNSLSSELLTDPSFDSFSNSSTLAQWTTDVPFGSPTLTEEASFIHTGGSTRSAKIAGNVDNPDILGIQSVLITGRTPGNTLNFSGWAGNNGVGDGNGIGGAFFLDRKTPSASQNIYNFTTVAWEAVSNSGPVAGYSPWNNLFSGNVTDYVLVNSISSPFVNFTGSLTVPANGQICVVGMGLKTSSGAFTVYLDDFSLKEVVTAAAVTIYDRRNASVKANLDASDYIFKFGLASSLFGLAQKGDGSLATSFTKFNFASSSKNVSVINGVANEDAVNLGQMNTAISAIFPINLTSQVTGVLPIANGGTNQTTFTSNAVVFYDGSDLESSSALIWDVTNELLSIGTSVGTNARLNVKAGSATYAQINLAPSAFLVGTPAAGNIEWDSNQLYITNLAGPTRNLVAQIAGATPLTVGSIPFVAGAQSYLTQDNSKLFWDNSNKRLGIGQTSPAYSIDVNGNIGNSAGGLDFYSGGSNTDISFNPIGSGKNLFNSNAGFLGLTNVFTNYGASTIPNVAAFLAPNTISNGPSYGPFFSVGVSNTNYNATAIQFSYFASGDSRNFCALGVYGFIAPLAVTSVAVGIVNTSPTANLHVGAGIAAASGAPFKLTSGTNLTTPEAGAIEYNGTNLFFTPGSGTRDTIATLLANQSFNGDINFAGRVTGAQATTTAGNSMTLGYRNQHIVGGNTQINLIDTTDWTAGSRVTLIFTGTPTVKHGQTVSGAYAPIFLAGSADFVAANNSVLCLEWNGTNWYETSRTVA